MGLRDFITHDLCFVYIQQKPVCFSFEAFKGHTLGSRAFFSFSLCFFIEFFPLFHIPFYHRGALFWP